jgi:uncharacterized protein YecT (DUF1311 family)
MTLKPRKQPDSGVDQRSERSLPTLLSSVQNRVLIAGLLTIVFLAFPLAAACSDECDHSVSTAAKAACEAGRLKAVSDQVGREYDRVVAEFPKSRFFLNPNFKINQDAWTTYVDSQCEPEADLMLGSAGAWVIPQCKAKAYQKRLIFLTRMVRILKDSEQ